MTAHLYRPPEHFMRWPDLDEYPAGFRQVMVRFSGRPLERYVLDHYRTHRRPV